MAAPCPAQPSPAGPGRAFSAQPFNDVAAATISLIDILQLVGDYVAKGQGPPRRPEPRVALRPAPDKDWLSFELDKEKRLVL